MPRKNTHTHPDNFVTRQEMTEAIEELAQITKNGFDVVQKEFVDVRKDIAKLDERNDRMERTMGHMLTVLEENNSLLKGLRTLPARVDRLEQRIFGA